MTDRDDGPPSGETPGPDNDAQQRLTTSGDYYRGYRQGYADALEVAALRGEPSPDPLREALRPFAHFAEMWEQKPLNRASDDHVVYGIHGGTPWEGTLTLGDFRRAAAALRGEPSPQPERRTE